MDLEMVLELILSILSILESIFHGYVARPILIGHDVLAIVGDVLLITILELFRENCQQYFRENFRSFDVFIDERVASVPLWRANFKEFIGNDLLEYVIYFILIIPGLFGTLGPTASLFLRVVLPGTFWWYV